MACVNEHNGDALANLPEVPTGEEIPEPQERQPQQPQPRNKDGVVNSLEGMDMTMHNSPHALVEAEAELMNLIKEFQRLDPPAFMGASDPAVAEEWFREIEKKLGLMRATDGQRVALATSMLKGEAIYWWAVNKHTMDIDGMTWRDFQDTFLERYFPFSDCNMTKYELMRLARKEKKATKFPNNNPQQNKQRYHPYSQPTPTGSVAKMKCYKCGLRGHENRKCPLWQHEQQELPCGASMETAWPTPTGTSVAKMKCYKCGLRGHENRKCPLWQQEQQELPCGASINESSNPNPRGQEQRQHRHLYSQPALVVEGQEAQQTSVDKWKCHQCGQIGHLRKFCPLWQRQEQQHPHSQPALVIEGQGQEQQRHRHLYSQPALVVEGQEAQQTSVGKWKRHQCGQIGHLRNFYPLWQQQEQHPHSQPALVIEGQGQEQQRHHHLYSQPALVVEGQEAQQTSVGEWKCHQCGQIGHLRKFCPLWQQQEQQHTHSQPALVIEGQEAQQTSFGDRKCNKCGQIGHWRKDCPLWQQEQQQHPYSQPELVVEGQEAQQTSACKWKCHQCGQIGHLKEDCPMSPQQKNKKQKQQQQQQQQPQVALVEVDIQGFLDAEKKRKERKTKMKSNPNPCKEKQHHPLNQPAPVVEDQAQIICSNPNPCKEKQHHPLNQPAPVVEDQAQIICSNPNPCKEKQHHPLNQPAPVVEDQAQRICFICGQAGHYKKDCPVRRQQQQEQEQEQQQQEEQQQQVARQPALVAEDQAQRICSNPNPCKQKQYNPLNQPAPVVEDQTQRICFICGQIGHSKKDCPVRQQQQQQVARQCGTMEALRGTNLEGTPTSTQQGAEQGPHQQLTRRQARKLSKKQKKRLFSQLGAPLSAFLPELVKQGMVTLKDPRPLPSNVSKGFGHDAYCDFHQSPGHTTDQCIPLRNAIQDLLEADKIQLRGAQLPAQTNVNNNP